MLSFSPPERKTLIFIVFLIFLGTLIRYYNLEVENVLVSSSEVTAEEPLLVNVNEAGAVCLEKIPGIGPVLARRIIEYRVKHQSFEKVRDLKKVNGIGQYKAETMSRYIEF